MTQSDCVRGSVVDHSQLTRAGGIPCVNWCMTLLVSNTIENSCKLYVYVPYVRGYGSIPSPTPPHMYVPQYLVVGVQLVSALHMYVHT